MNQDLQIDTIDSVVRKRAQRNPDEKLQYPEFHNSVGSIIATHGKTGEHMHQEMIIYDSNAVDNGDYIDSAQADQPLLLADQFYDDDEPEDDDQSSQQADNDDFSDSASDNNEQTPTAIHDDGNPPALDGESGESDDLNDQVINENTQENEGKQIKSGTSNA